MSYKKEFLVVPQTCRVCAAKDAFPR